MDLIFSPSGKKWNYFTGPTVSEVVQVDLFLGPSDLVRFSVASIFGGNSAPIYFPVDLGASMALS